MIWLMKSEPDVYSIDNLAKDKKTWWEGVRNYQARNFMTQQMKVGDTVLFYHSNAEPPGIAGIAQVSHSAMPDDSQYNKKSEYFEPRASREKPVWQCVQVEFVEKFDELIPLEVLKKQKNLESMLVLKKGQRLSIQPVTEQEFKVILKMAAKK